MKSTEAIALPPAQDWQRYDDVSESLLPPTTCVAESQKIQWRREATETIEHFRVVMLLNVDLILTAGGSAARHLARSRPAR